MWLHSSTNGGYCENAIFFKVLHLWPAERIKQAWTAALKFSRWIRNLYILIRLKYVYLLLVFKVTTNTVSFLFMYFRMADVLNHPWSPYVAMAGIAIATIILVKKLRSRKRYFYDYCQCYMKDLRPIIFNWLWTEEFDRAMHLLSLDEHFSCSYLIN